LSKELGLNIKELMAFLNPLGANVRNHMSTIDDKFVEQARQAFPVAAKQVKFFGTAKAPEVPSVEARGESIKPKPVNKMETEVSSRNAVSTAGHTAVNRNVDVTAKQGVPQQKNVREHSTQPEILRQRPNQPGNVKNAGPRISSPANQVRTGNAQERKAVTNQGRPAFHGNGADAHSNRQAEPSRQTGAGSKNGTARYNPQSDQSRSVSGGRTAPNSGSKKSQVPVQRAGQRQNQGPVQRQNQSPGQRQAQGFNQRNGQGNSGSRQEGQGSFGNRGGAHSQNNPNRSRQGYPAVVRQRVPAKPQGPVTSVKSIQLPDFMSIKDFSQLVELPASDIIKKLIGLGVMATINQEIDRDTMILIADEYGIVATAAKTEEEKLEFVETEDDPSTLINRPPVVTILGHVDHGKTSLLDAIRETNVTSQEAGGITQHIGAYQVELKERKITFLDTPGHAAFTAMRARGAQVTDIAILVVAADDGVMPQTIEAINHVQDANVPIIVAINKIDKVESNLDRIKTDLMQYGLVDESLGGETIFVPVSAKKRIGIETLLEMILLVADVKDLKANPNRLAKGTIIEAKLDKGRGPVATVLVQNGTLQMGDPIIAGAAAGKVKVLNNDKGKRVKKAGPSTPVEVIGFNEVPAAGDILHVTSEDRSARQLADKRMQYKRETELRKNQKITLDDLFTKIKEGEIKEVKIVLKADVQGSVEAIRQSLEQLSTEEVRVKVIQGGVGGIGEGDVMLASASNAVIIGFNVRPDPSAKRSAEKENVDIRLYRVIYNIIEDVQKAMEGMLEPTFKEVINGKAEIRQIYKVPKVGNIGGCYVLEGKITRNSDIRLIRDNIVIFEGEIESLKRFKDDAKEVTEGFECGIGIEKYNDIKEGDIIEAFSMEEVKRTITK
jgi:translation initiation factor IF-2